MASSAQKIARGFDRLSWVYDSIVRLVFGDRLNELQRKTLSEVGTANNILMVGGGSGVLLPFILEQTRAQSLHFVELSSKMRQKASARLNPGQLEKVSFLENLDGRENQKFDLILLPFVLDCYPADSVSVMLKTFRQKMPAQGQLIITDFSAEKASGYQHQWVKGAFIQLLYSFFKTTAAIEGRSLAPFDQLAMEAGLEQVNKEMILGGWVQSTQWALPRKAQSTE